MIKKFKKLKQIVDLIEDDKMSRKEFLENFEKILKFLMDLKEQNEKKFESLKENINNLSDELKEENTDNFRGFKDRFSEIAEQALKKQEDGLNFIKDKARNITRGKEGEKGKDADETKIITSVLARIKLPEQKETILDTPEQIVDKLESLEGDERLAISAIDKLREELDKLNKMKQQVVYTGGGSSGGGRIVRAHDLSASLDSSTKTFSLPAFWRIISVHLSSFPNVLRETTDYTVDAAAMTIQFTAEIDAASSLANGQTCIVIFSE